MVHVVCDVLAEDVSPVDVGVQLAVVAVLLVEAGEPLAGVGDVDAAVDGALHGTEHLGAGRGAGKAYVQAGVEGAPLVVVLNQEVVAVNLHLAGVHGVQLVLLQEPPCKQKTGAVSGGIVGEADLDSELGQLGGIGSADNKVTLQVSISNLTGDVLVGDPDNHTMLGGVVLVLVLDHKTLAGIVVGLALAAPAELDLEPLEVSLVLDDFDVHHLDGVSLRRARISDDLEKNGPGSKIDLVTAYGGESNHVSTLVPLILAASEGLGAIIFQSNL